MMIQQLMNNPTAHLSLSITNDHEWRKRQTSARHCLVFSKQLTADDGQFRSSAFNNKIQFFMHPRSLALD